jgi:hypothetical protein
MWEIIVSVRHSYLTNFIIVTLMLLIPWIVRPVQSSNAQLWWSCNDWWFLFVERLSRSYCSSCGLWMIRSTTCIYWYCKDSQFSIFQTQITGGTGHSTVDNCELFKLRSFRFIFNATVARIFSMNQCSWVCCRQFLVYLRSSSISPKDNRAGIYFGGANCYK